MTVNVSELAGRLAEGMDRAVVDAQRTAFALTVALLARGHALIEGVPGTGKTLAVRALAAAARRRVPAHSVYARPDAGRRRRHDGFQSARPPSFRTRLGPIFANVVLADEINRTPPKTQAALLEAMEEGQRHDRRRAASAAAAVSRLRDAKSDRIRRHVSAARSAARPLHGKIATDVPGEAHELELLERVAAGFDARELDASGIAPVTKRGEVIEAQRAIAHGTSVGERARLYVSHRRRARATHPRLTLGAIAARGHCAAARIASGCRDRRPRRS